MAKRHHIAHIEAWRRQPRAVDQFDPVLLAAGLHAPALSAKDQCINRRRAAAFVAAQIAANRPRSDAQRLRAQQARTVAGKIVRQEVREILTRLRWLGAVRVSGVK